MFSHSHTSRCFAQLAIHAASAYVRLQQQQEEELAPDSMASTTTSSASTALWFDDTAAAAAAHANHIASDAYKELHRPALTTSAMGLFGGEPGFEKSHRVWVDPDRPHMKHMYNQTALAKNLRYARYGYFKRDMHLLDVEKLIRHARLLPTPNRLLGDFLYQRVPLPDRSCAAFLRYQREQIEMLEPWRRTTSLGCAEEMFERMAVTNLPPVEVGVRAHAEMIRCCALCKEWRKGWEVYAERAREMEEANPEGAELTTEFFDAVMELCVACERHEEGLQVMREVIERHLRPLPSILNKAMILVSIAAEKTSASISTNATAPEEEADVAQSPCSSSSPNSMKDDVATASSNVMQQGVDLWTLYDFYHLQRTTDSVEAYMRMCGMLNRPDLCMTALQTADAAGIRLNLACLHWLCFALRTIPNMANYLMELLSSLRARGLTPDYLLFEMLMLYAAMQKDGELAVAIYQQYWHPSEVHPTPEAVLLLLQACAYSTDPSVAMITAASELMERLEKQGSAVDLRSEMFNAFLDLTAACGAISTAYSSLKKLVQLGIPLSTRQLNSLLMANANATELNGSRAMTEELVELFQMLQVASNADTLDMLEHCISAYGESDKIQAFAAHCHDVASSSNTVKEDAEMAVREVPPHRLRRLQTAWNLRPRDIALRRHGQSGSTRPAADVGSMIGSIIPFGRSPGERNV